MLMAEGQQSGILLDYVEDDREFARSLGEAIKQIANPEIRQRYAEAAKVCGKSFDLDSLADDYLQIYDEVPAQFELSRR
jgi:glycosyltransferase involved in cell wall biosynthesis